MKFPDILTLAVLDRETRLPVPNVALVMELFAPRKNNYIVGPAISNEHGLAIFTRAGCERSITADQEMFLMDYVGKLEDCKGYAEFRLHPPEQIKAMMKHYKSAPDFWGKGFDDPDQLFADLAHVTNAEFESASITVDEAMLVANPEVALYVSRRR